MTDTVPSANDPVPGENAAVDNAALRERVSMLEGCIARLADDARAALSESTYSRLATEHTVMRNSLYAVMQVTEGKPSLAHLHALAENAYPKEATSHG